MPSLRVSLWLLLCFATSSVRSSAADAKSPSPGHEFVELLSVIPNLVIELPYATENNFFKHRFYPDHRCFLRRAVAEKLALVQRDLNAMGLGLKVWDGYRPRSVQWTFWKVLPDPNYVADPAKGSRHNRGAAVDLTLIDLKSGQELEMPTGYDDFTPKAAADFKLASAAAIKNRQTLQQAMTRHGFQIFPSEWWHFDAEAWEQYPLEDIDPRTTTTTPAKPSSPSSALQPSTSPLTRDASKRLTSASNSAGS